MQNIDKYSNDEIKIGTWIDGKPIYRHTYNIITPLTADTAENLVTLPTSFNKLINIYGVIHNITDEIPINVYGSTAYNYSRTWVSGSQNSIRATVGDNLKNKSVTIILEYTKTTD